MSSSSIVYGAVRYNMRRPVPITIRIGAAHYDIRGPVPGAPIDIATALKGRGHLARQEILGKLAIRVQRAAGITKARPQARAEKKKVATHGSRYSYTRPTISMGATL